jgi:hypothetical protein
VISERRTQGKRVLAALVCGAALLASGCGSDDEGKDIPKNSAAELQSSLDSIQRRVELGDGACRDVVEGNDTDVSAVQRKIDALPASVDKDVKDALQESFNNLFDLVEQKCKQTNTETETTPTATEPTPTVTETVPPETTPTQTTPTQTTPTPPNDGKDKPKDQPKGKDKNGGGGTRAPEGG